MLLEILNTVTEMKNWIETLEDKLRKSSRIKDNKTGRGAGQDGGRVRRGDHLPSHRYIRNTSTRITAPTEHPLHAGRRRQNSQKAKNSPRTWVGQKKKKK